jgi:hypothetical protein
LAEPPPWPKGVACFKKKKKKKKKKEKRKKKKKKKKERGGRNHPMGGGWPPLRPWGWPPPRPRFGHPCFLSFFLIIDLIFKIKFKKLIF